MPKLSSEFLQYCLCVCACVLIQSSIILLHMQQAYIEGNSDSAATAGADLGVWTAGCQ